MQAAAASNLKRVALELGGKSPQIVLDDCADLDAAASAIAWSIFYNCGQTCHAGSRLIVHKSIANDLYDRIRSVSESLKMGHPLDPDTQIGALADPIQYDRVMSFLELANVEGGTVHFGGRSAKVVPGGCYIQPTMVKNVRNDTRIASEEIFGPLLVTIEFDTDDEALALANQTKYGLAASIWTSDINRAHRFSENLVAGTVWVNTYDQSSMSTPFGGFKHSGFGRDRSPHAIDKYTDLKTVWTHFGGAGS